MPLYCSERAFVDASHSMKSFRLAIMPPISKYYNVVESIVTYGARMNNNIIIINNLFKASKKVIALS